MRGLLSLIALILVIGTQSVAAGTATAAQATPTVMPRVRFVSGSGISLQRLVAGGIGNGDLLYYLPSHGPTKPSLVVRLQRAAGSTGAVASIYQAGPLSSTVPITIADGRVTLPRALHPAITMVAPGGWWFRHGLPNYTLRVRVQGYIYAMWGYPAYAGLPSKSGFSFVIQTHADSHGVPQWDLRQLLTDLGSDAVIRTNYVERRCAGPLRRGPSPAPLWPYVAPSGQFEQPNGHLAPPVVVDWQTGKIQAFSELVTLRFQSCSYGMYSLDPPPRKATPEPSFESPWGFYDLSGRHNGYPNLIIRTEHYQRSSAWYFAIDSILDALPPPSRPSEVVRYSWADHPGNNQYDFKVDVFGFHRYSATQRLAGGLLHVVQPSYREYPTWVIGKRWPLATFVDTNEGGYATSEGIYDWSARNVGTGYWLGWTGTPDLTQFQTISKGLRGEYRLSVNDQAVLYASDIDHRLHLLHADGGLWNIKGRVSLQESNLTHGAYIDDWKLLRLTPTGAGKRAVHRVTAETAVLHGYVLSSGPAGVTIRQAHYREESFRILPPTDARTWASFISRTQRYRWPNAVPDLVGWARQFTGPAFQASHASLSKIQAMPDGFRLVLHLATPASSSGQVPDLKVPDKAGSYVLTYDANHGRWSVHDASPPSIAVHLSLPPRTVALYSTHLGVAIRNRGAESWNGTVTLTVPAAKLKGKILYRTIDSRAVSVDGGTIRRYVAAWSPKPAGRAPIPVHIQVSGRPSTIQYFVVRPTLRPSARTMISVSLPSTWPFAESLLLAFFVVLGTAVTWRWAYGRI